jgi:ATP-dependent Lhr-like helicase
VSRDDLIECAALLRSVRQGELDRIVSLDAPLDVLAQQIAAEASSREMREDELFDFVRRAWPYRRSTRATSTRSSRCWRKAFRRARRRARRSCIAMKCIRSSKDDAGTRMLALTSGGAIPKSPIIGSSSSPKTPSSAR